MKILIVINGFTKSGGMRVLTNISNELIKMGDEVSFVFADDFSQPYFPSLARIVRIKNILKNFKILNILIKQILLILYLLRKSSNYDAVIASHNSTAFPVWLCTRGKTTGFYYIQAYEPEFYSDKLIQIIKSKIAKFTYKLNLVKIVNAEIYKNYKEIQAIHLVEPGIDLNIFNAADVRKKKENIINIGCIGRRDLWKGTSIIIDAFNLLHNEFNKDEIRIQLNIAFELPDGFDEGSLPPSVEYTKPHGDLNLSNFYKLNEIFVATGLIQNGAFHYPCMEALACGCSVISNYSPAKDEYAYILNEVTVESVKAKILIALNDCQIGKSKKIDKNKLEKFSWDVTAQKFKKIINDEIVMM